MDSSLKCLGVIVMITANELLALKIKVKKEMQRRSGYGSLANLANSSYDFVTEPVKGQIIKEEHGKKTIDLLLQIKDKGDLKFVQKGDLIPDSFDNSLLAYVDELSKETMEGNKSSCRGACTGLCFGSCVNGCVGCGGNCTGCSNCTSSCGSTCASQCTSCGSGCSGGCKGCSASCGSGCASSCGSTCSSGAKK